MAEECEPICCTCSGSTKEYFGVFCARGICATAEATCAATADDGCM